MKIGVPKEIKDSERRVALTPAAVSDLRRGGHEILIQAGAGLGSGMADSQYVDAGARIVPDAESVFREADLVVKVKEPQPNECAMLRKGQILFAYLHLAPDPAQTAALIRSGAVCIGFETVGSVGGGLPLLAPMSEVAGRMAVHCAAVCLERPRGGRGVLLSGVPGVPPARMVILGGGVVGTNALQVAVGMGAQVTLIDRDLEKLRRIDFAYHGRVETQFSAIDNVEAAVAGADVVIGGVLVPGGAAPKLVTREMVSRMRAGAVLVDVAIDQGGCFETSRPTTHSDPTFIVDDVVHYCVANMPGAVPRTSTYALSNAISPYVQALANKGWHGALEDDKYLRMGLNVCDGQIVHDEVANALDGLPRTHLQWAN